MSVYQDCILALTFLLSIPRSNARPDSPPSPDDVDPQGAFDRYRTGNHTVIIAKPIYQPPAYNVALEDYLHVVIACSLALLLATLLGLFIRHYGLALRPVKLRLRAKLSRAQAGDTERNVSQGQGGVAELPEKPAAAHLKW